MTRLQSISRILFAAVSLILIGYESHAQLAATNYHKFFPNDSLGKEPTPYAIIGKQKGADLILQKNSASILDGENEMLENIDANIKKPAERRRLMAYLKQATNNNDVNYTRSRTKFYYHLANIFARMRLYPLAMKCFFRTTAQYNNQYTGSGRLQELPQQNYANETDSLKVDSSYLSINSNDDSVINKNPAVFEGADHFQDNSPPITYQRIINTFNDGKQAAGYAILVHVKQPAPGKPKIFVLTNTGHTFITLIKYNTDSTYISLSFGFYPHKDNILSATPIIPSSTSVFKNDSGHRWDEVIGKFISKRKFEKILLLTKQYHGMKYHLSKNNCTDFGISAATVAGIDIINTSGSWPLGKGNNPGVTGQSILQGNFKNLDTGNFNGLFVDNNPGTVK